MSECAAGGKKRAKATHINLHVLSSAEELSHRVVVVNFKILWTRVLFFCFVSLGVFSTFANEVGNIE